MSILADLIESQTEVISTPSNQVSDCQDLKDVLKSIEKEHALEIESHRREAASLLNKAGAEIVALKAEVARLTQSRAECREHVDEIVEARNAAKAELKSMTEQMLRNVDSYRAAEARAALLGRALEFAADELEGYQPREATVAGMRKALAAFGKVKP